MRDYKLKFETPTELVTFIRNMGDKIMNYSADGNVFTFSSGYDYRELLSEISKITDAYVMYETLAYEEEYDGKRFYEKYWDDENDDYSEELKRIIPASDISNYFSVH